MAIVAAAAGAGAAMTDNMAAGAQGVRGVPANDDCSGAIAINIGEVLGDTSGATLDGAPACVLSGPDGVWYTFVGNEATLAVTTCGAGTDYDSALHVYTGGCGALTCVGGNDDTCEIQAQVMVSTAAGETYWALVESFRSAEGNFQLVVGTPPRSDCPKGARQEGEGEPCGIPSDFFNGGCNSEPEVYSPIECGETVCGSSAFDGAGVRDADWYRVTISEPTLVTWWMDEAAFDWQLFIIDLAPGCDGAVVVAQASGAAGEPGFCQIFPCMAGAYAFVVTPQALSPVDCPSPYVVTMSCEQVIFPEYGVCEKPIAVGIPSSNEGATFALDCAAQSITCGTSVDGAGWWYSVQGTGTTITASLCAGTDYDSKLFVYRGDDCGNLVCVAGDDDFCAPGGASQVSFCSVAGETYRIVVSGSGSSQGTYTLEITESGVACGTPCDVKCYEFSKVENEADCGLPLDTVNGGCNSTPPVFSSIYCSDASYLTCGTVGVEGDARDTDWYAFEQRRDCKLSYTFEIIADFPFVADYVEWQPGFEGSGDCAFVTGQLNPSITGVGDCSPQYLEFAVSHPGTHWIFIAPLAGAAASCGAADGNRYTLVCYGGKGNGDCNENCIQDSLDIASGFSKDCFDYNAVPGISGGPNGIPDECECLPDWNRDGVANSTDVSEFINTYFQDQSLERTDGDINCDGTSNSTDVSDFINIWFRAQAGQLPQAGCST